jgi:hypothetical protein
MADKERNGVTRGWLISSTPWPGCPVVFNLVVITENNETATTMFKDFFKKDDLEITAMFPVEIIDEKTGIPTLN